MSDVLDPRTSRRTMLKTALGTGFVLAFHMPLAEAQTSPNVAQGTTPDTAPFQPNAFIRIDPQGKTTLVMPQTEMGQGVYTSIAMIIAEELDADWTKVVLEAAPPNEKLYANPMLSVQATGNSNSIRAFWTPLRKA
ncbi:MAG TPA: molybdopterin cofactor-binding domain-containing protein, partial [Rhizomicrobium sp.]|nr:molybdopterin cofactor-binding domain-containing protein [Rhizomicrobium sp.]